MMMKSLVKLKQIEIKKGKHLCQIECANDFNKTIKSFIDKNYDQA